MSVSSALPRVLRGLALTVVVAAASAATLAALPGNAAAAPGGDVRIHATTTAFDDPRDEPTVCRFYLAAFDVAPAQAVTWSIAPQPGRVGGAALDGTFALVAGTGRTGPLSLPAGQYQLTWHAVGQTGSAAPKLFDVACPTDTGLPGGVLSPQDRDVFGNLVPAGGADLGTGSTAASDDAFRIAAGIAIACGALYFGLRLLRRSRR